MSARKGRRGSSGFLCDLVTEDGLVFWYAMGTNPCKEELL